MYCSQYTSVFGSSNKDKTSGELRFFPALRYTVSYTMCFMDLYLLVGGYIA